MINYILNIFTSYNCFDLLAFLGMTAAKVTFLLAFAAGIGLIFRRLSAAARHLLWTSVLCASLLMPFLSYVKGWEISIFPASVSALNTSTKLNESREGTASAKDLVSQEKADSFQLTNQTKESETSKKAEFLKESLPATNTSGRETAVQGAAPPLTSILIKLALAIWVFGAFLLLFRLLIGVISTNLLVRRAAQFDNEAIKGLFSTLLKEVNLKDNVRLLKSETLLMPIVCGIWRPAVIFPSAAQQWTEERCRMVLLHELTHIARRDCLTQRLAQIACVFYWFNPFIWAAARRLRIEREQACDEYVLSLGTRASDYARHLLEIARSMQEKKRNSIFEWSQTTVAMAQASQLEGRLLAILKINENHSQLSRSMVVSLVFLVSFLFLTVVMIHPTTINARNPPTTGIVNNSNPDTTGENYFPESSSKNDFRSQPAKDENKLFEKKENNSGVDELTVPNQTENFTQSEQIAEQTGESKIEQNTDQGSPQVEKNEQNPDPVSSPSPNPQPMPFVNANYKREDNGPESSAQEKTEDFIEEMASVGYKNLSVDELINLKSIGVSAAYVKGLRALGFDNLTVKELCNMRAVGVTPDYIESIRGAGYKVATAREFANLRALNVTAEYIDTLRKNGYDNLSLKEITDFRANNITIDFIHSMNAIGFGKLSSKDLVKARIFGVTTEFVRLARTRLGDDLTLKQIIDLKMTGILKEKDKDKDNQ